MYRRILVPVDMSHTERGNTAVEAAKKLADDGTIITLVNIIEDVPGYVMTALPEGVIKEQKTRAQKALAGIATEAGVKADVEVGHGRAHTAILNIAKKLDADLIIVASHEPGLQDYLLGSTASRVVRHATCAVLVIR